MKTTIIFANGNGEEDHICLEGVVEPQIENPIVRFVSSDGERFVLNLAKFIGAYTFKPDEADVVPLKVAN